MSTDQNMYDGYIKTISGRKFYLGRDDPRQIDIADITHALSNVCRFSGHVTRFYSVAEHSLLVYHLLLSWGVTSSKTLMTGLLHDATEAYLPDMPTPFKAMMPEFQAHEEFLWQVIAKHFDLWARPEDVPDIDFNDVLLMKVSGETTGRSLIKHADRTALFIEAKLLQPNGDVALWPEYELYSPLANAWIRSHTLPLPAGTMLTMDMNKEMLNVFNFLKYTRLITEQR